MYYIIEYHGISMITLPLGVGEDETKLEIVSFNLFGLFKVKVIFVNGTNIILISQVECIKANFFGNLENVETY